MSRYFVYGSVAVIAAIGAMFYVNFTMHDWLSGTAPGLERTLMLCTSLGASCLAYALVAAMQMPLGVVFQRHILLGEPPRHPYFAYWSSNYGRRVFWASVAIYGYFFGASLIHVPFFIAVYQTDPFDEVAVSTLFATTPSALAAFVGIYLLASFCASLLAARSSLAFPIAAADRPGSALRQSFAESRGAMWRLFFVFVLVYVPAFAAYVVALFIVIITFVIQNPVLARMGVSPFPEMNAGLLNSPAFIIAAIIALVAFTLSQVAMMAAAARAYQIRVERGLSGVADVFS
jgi:hypothetical protein